MPSWLSARRCAEDRFLSRAAWEGVVADVLEQLSELVLQKDLWNHEEQLCPVGAEAGGLGGQAASMRSHHQGL